MGVLRDELKNDPLGLGYAVHLPDDPQRVVDLLTAQNYTMVKSRYVTARTILAECTDGAAILDALSELGSTISEVKWMMTFLQQDSGMDAGHPKTQGQLTLLAQDGAINQAFADELKALAVQPACRADVLGIPVPATRGVTDAWSN